MVTSIAIDGAAGGIDRKPLFQGMIADSGVEPLPRIEEPRGVDVSVETFTRMRVSKAERLLALCSYFACLMHWVESDSAV